MGMRGRPVKDWLVGIHVNVMRLIDEGVVPVLGRSLEAAEGPRREHGFRP
jgi:hypothetical protein